MLFIRNKSLSAGRKAENKNIAHITYAFVILFIAMIAYIGYFTYFKAPDFINSSYNSRQELYAKKVVRGKILSKDGEVLAETVTNEDGSETRRYPCRNLFAHAVGYSTKGKTGVELLANFTLLTSDAFILDRIRNDLNGVKNIGDNVITTLDPAMQAAAYNALGSYRGAVIAMDVKTGEILCMVSKPDFDPNNIVQAWDEINADTEQSALLNRVTNGLYPPGSTFKMVTLLEFIRENSDKELEDYSYECNGSYSIDGFTINCYHGVEHGDLNLKSAFSESCNSAFASIGVSLDKKAFQETCETLLFNKKLPVKMSYRESYVPINENSDLGEVMQTAIGQGKTQATPLHIAMITQAIANEGELMKPYLIRRVENWAGDTIKEYKPHSAGRILEPGDALKLKAYLADTVENGTATRLKSDLYSAAGKTGSAEYSKNKAMSHAWFTGFAPVEDPRVAVTVIAEEAGSGGLFAVPMAKAVFDAYFK
ncbi:MAG: penicillin-binding protein 2 [Lachnospiraceae bacterium]|nr:penicillin-binding protein 2 [Lachnospiraceae bacterium]